MPIVGDAGMLYGVQQQLLRAVLNQLALLACQIKRRQQLGHFLNSRIERGNIIFQRYLIHLVCLVLRQQQERYEPGRTTSETQELRDQEDEGKHHHTTGGEGIPDESVVARTAKQRQQRQQHDGNLDDDHWRQGDTSLHLKQIGQRQYHADRCQTADEDNHTRVGHRLQLRRIRTEESCQYPWEKHDKSCQDQRDAKDKPQTAPD